jgi:hypothetical protein
VRIGKINKEKGTNMNRGGKERGNGIGKGVKMKKL